MIFQTALKRNLPKVFTTEYGDVLVNQEIEFNIGGYAEEQQGNDDNVAYLADAKVTSGNNTKMELISTTPKGYDIKFTAPGTYVVDANFKCLDGDDDFLDVTLTFTVT